MSDSQILGWASRFREDHHKEPIRVGDLFVTACKLHGQKFYPRGTLCLVLGPAEDLTNWETCVSVMIDGVIEDISPSNLEVIDETG